MSGQAEISKLRSRIDAVDAELRDLLLRRLEIATEILNLKSQAGFAVTDEAREAEIRAAVLNGASESEKIYLDQVLSAILRATKECFTARR